MGPILQILARDGQPPAHGGCIRTFYRRSPACKSPPPSGRSSPTVPMILSPSASPRSFPPLEPRQADDSNHFRAVERLGEKVVGAEVKHRRPQGGVRRFSSYDQQRRKRQAGYRLQECMPVAVRQLRLRDHHGNRSLPKEAYSLQPGPCEVEFPLGMIENSPERPMICLDGTNEQDGHVTPHGPASHVHDTPILRR